MLKQNWLTVDDVTNLLHLGGFQVFRAWQEVLCPLPMPVLAPLCNRVLVRLWGVRHLALTNFVLARPLDRPTTRQRGSRGVGHRAGAQRGGQHRRRSSRGHRRWAAAPSWSSSRAIRPTTPTTPSSARSPRIPAGTARLLRQTGKGKGDAVRLGFADATGDILMILDADLTVPPEDLPRFYDALRSGKGEFVNGVRLVYPMEEQAMRFANLLGNKFFSLAFTWLLGQPIKDTLCGTKVLAPRRATSASPPTAPTSAISIRSATSTCCSAPRS